MLHSLALLAALLVLLLLAQECHGASASSLARSVRAAKRSKGGAQQPSAAKDLRSRRDADAADSDDDDDAEANEGAVGDEEDVDGDDDEDDEDDDDTADRRQGKGRRRPAQLAKKKREPSMLGQGLASATDFANMALKMTKGSVKAAVDLCANKHVSLLQIVGKWRIQQEIEVRKGVFMACPATIEFLEDGSVVTMCEGQEYKSDFSFKERSWPRKCTISFQARAFQGPKDPEPVAMYYKGYFKRSILNPNVVLIRGKVYRLSGKLL